MLVLVIVPVVTIATGVVIIVKGRRWWWLGLVLTILGALWFLAIGALALWSWSWQGLP